jgi:hypothetical protein
VITCNCVAVLQGGVLAFPAAAVRTMKVMALLPQQPLVRAVKKGVDKWYETHHKANPYKAAKMKPMAAA